MSWSTADSERARHQICVRKARKRSRNAVLRDSRNGSSDPYQLHSDWGIGSSRFTYCRLYLSLD